MKWLTASKWRKLVLAAGAFLVVVCVMVLIVHTHSKGPLESYKDKLRAAGEKLTIAELLPPALPAEQNGATLLSPVFPLLNLADSNLPPVMRLVAPGKAMVGWQQPHVYNADGTNSWENAELAIGLNGEVLDGLQVVFRQPALDFELRYQDGFDLLLPHLSPLRQSARLLSAAVVCDLHAGDIGAARTNSRAMLALVKGWRTEPLLISQLVRLAMTAITVGTHWELLQAPAITDEDLAVLQRDWMEVDLIRPMENAHVMERAIVQMTFAGMRASNSPSAALHGFGSGHSGSDPKRWVATALWRVSWSHIDELRTLQMQEFAINAFRAIATNVSFNEAILEFNRNLSALRSVTATNRLDWLWEKIDDDGLRHRGVRSFVTGDHVIKRLMRAETSRQLVITAIALQRHRLRHGSYPSELADLVPAFLPAVPRDPVDGQPLRYRREADGIFLLYSVGEDARDDGGDATSTKTTSTKTTSADWLSGRDWVWPQPATTDEVRDFHDASSLKRR